MVLYWEGPVTCSWWLKEQEATSALSLIPSFAVSVLNSSLTYVTVTWYCRWYSWMCELELLLTFWYYCIQLRIEYNLLLLLLFYLPLLRYVLVSILLLFGCYYCPNECWKITSSSTIHCHNHYLLSCHITRILSPFRPSLIFFSFHHPVA